LRARFANGLTLAGHPATRGRVWLLEDSVGATDSHEREEPHVSKESPLRGSDHSRCLAADDHRRRVPALGARDRSAPTTPGNLRITALTPYTVSLAWDASKDNSGIASYKICCAYTNSETVSGTATTHTYTKGLEASRQFSLIIVAIDNAGNYSKNSNSVSFTTPPDTTPPTKPTVTVTDIGPTHISLAWSSVEDGPNVWFAVTMDGNSVISGGRATSGTFGALEPATTHTFTVQAADFANNLSPLSDPVTVTTAPRDASDTTPPTMPGNLNTAGM